MRRQIPFAPIRGHPALPPDGHDMRARSTRSVSVTAGPLSNRGCRRRILPCSRGRDGRRHAKFRASRQARWRARSASRADHREQAAGPVGPGEGGDRGRQPPENPATPLNEEVRIALEARAGPPPLVWRGEIRISGCRAHSDRPHAGPSLGRGSVAQGRVQALPIVQLLTTRPIVRQLATRSRLSTLGIPGLGARFAFTR